MNYQHDGLDNYFHLAAQRHDELLVVSFTDNADHDRSEAEQALRQAQTTAQAAAEAERQRLLGLLMSLPAIIASYRGPQHVYELVSPGFQMLFPSRQVVGRPIREALPELAGQQYFELLDHVYATGEPFYGAEMESWVDFTNTGKLEVGYFNVFFQATRDPEGHIDGLLSFAYDVTEQVLARQRVQGLNLELGNANEELAAANEELAAANEELAAANEELQAANEEFQINNTELLRTQQQLHRLNDELETHIAARTREAEATRAEAERQRARLERLFKQAPAYITIYHGPELVFEFVHPQTQAQMGGRVLLGRPRREALPEMDEASHALFERVYQTGLPVQGLAVPSRFDWDGTGQPYERYFDFTCQAIYDEAGAVEGVMNFALDVTERVLNQRRVEALQAEMLAAARQQLAEREAFHQVFEQAPALVLLLRAPGHHIDYVNPAYQRLFPDRQLIGLDLAVALPELRTHGFIALMDRVYQTGETYHGVEVPFEVPAHHAEPARLAYFTFTYQAYRENGQIAGISVFASEVTEQVLARQEREAQQERLREVFEQAPVAICVFRGAAYVLEVVNPPMGRMLGYAPQALVGRPFFEALPELESQGVRALLDEVRRTGTPFVAHEQEIAFDHHGQGGFGYYDFVYQPLRDEHGLVLAITCVATDVTD